MRGKHVVSLLMSSMGVALLVAATTVGAAWSATRKVGSSNALRGGTLRIAQSGGAFDTLDPGLAYVYNDWQVLYSTQLLLVNYPDRAGRAGAQLFPEAAKSFPTVSNHGRTLTFHLREGLRFSDGSPVTAASYRRAFERILSPKMYAQYGIFDRLNTMVDGAQKFADGKAAHISGIEAKGLTLTVHLTRPNPTFVSILAMPWFGAVKPTMPYTKRPGGITVYPSAGPYHIVTNRLGHIVVLKRSRYYHGARPANPDEIVIRSHPNTTGEKSLLQIEANQVDYDMAGVPAADVAAVAQKYGYPSNKNSQFHVAGESCTFWDALNTSRPPTNDVDVRKALNYALGRTSIVNLVGPYAADATDQILRPGMLGYKKLNVYGNAPNVEKAEQVGGSALKNAAPLNIAYNPQSQLSTSMATLEQSQIEQIGLTVNLVKEPLGGPLGLPYADYNLMLSGGCADFPDPAYSFTPFLGTQNTGNNVFSFRDPSFTRQAERAASLTGKARAGAYAALDRTLMTKYAPVVPLYVPNFRYLTSKRVHSVIFSHYLGGPILNAMSVR